MNKEKLNLILAALLHDVLDKKYVKSEEAADPYSFFLPLFQAAAKESNIDIIADGRARLIALIVDNVSWSTETKLKAADQWSEWHDSCVELHCVQDADRLDAIGAFGMDKSVDPLTPSPNISSGILRCAAYNASQNKYVCSLPCCLSGSSFILQSFTYPTRRCSCCPHCYSTLYR